MPARRPSGRSRQAPPSHPVHAAVSSGERLEQLQHITDLVYSVKDYYAVGELQVLAGRHTITRMWPFARTRDPMQDAIAGAVGLAAERWASFCRSSGMPGNIHLRDRVAFFAREFQQEAMRRFPTLRKAPDELLLLVIAEGIEASGLESRRMIELQLGIVLPR